MRSLSLAVVLSLSFSQGVMAVAQDSEAVNTTNNGNLAFQIKIPEKGCRSISMSLKDSTGIPVYPARIKLKKSQAKPGKFTDVLKFSVPAGQYDLANINCVSKERFMGIKYIPGKLTKNFKTEASEGSTRFNVDTGRDTYMGALDFHRLGAGGHALITLDESTEAVKKRQLTTGSFDKSFLTMSFDHQTVKARHEAKLTQRGDVEGQAKQTHKVVDSGKPPTNGRGQIAMHIKSDFDCNYINVGFVPSGGKKTGTRNLNIFNNKTAKFVGFSQNKEGRLEDFATVNVKSGRYKMLNITCGQDDGKYLQSQSLIRAEVDVYPKDIAYLGELYFKKTVDNTARLEARRKELAAQHPTMNESGINTLLSASRIPPYQFAMIMQDRFEDAKTQVKKPELLKKRKLDSTNYRKKEAANSQLTSLRVIKLRIKEVTEYEEALASYDTSMIVKP